MGIAACHNRKQRISHLKTELKTFGEKSEGSRQRMLEKKVRTLESKLVKQTQKEQTNKVHYEPLLKEERELLNRLKETSDHARQEAFDLHKSQLESLVSSLRVFVVKTCASDDCDIDRTSPLKTAIDNIVVDDITNATCDLTSQKYVYPDVDAWHQRVGYFQKIPTPFIRTDVGMGRDPKKGLAEMKRLAREVTSGMGQPLQSRKDWMSKSGITVVNDGNNNNNEIITGATRAAMEEADVKVLDDVYARVIRPFKATHPEHLQLNPGDDINSIVEQENFATTGLLRCSRK